MSDPDSNYAPVGDPVHFRTGVAAGYIRSAEVTTLVPANTASAVQMRGWEAGCCAGGDGTALRARATSTSERRTAR